MAIAVAQARRSDIPENVGTGTTAITTAITLKMARRLDGFWGQVDRRINQRILRLLPEGSILDVGCGFGKLDRVPSPPGETPSVST